MSDAEYPGQSDERIERLERKVAEIEALIKGLTEEMLDIKALTMRIQKDQRPAPVIQAVTPPAPSRNKTNRSEGEERHGPDESQAKPKKERISLKMQPDGTLAPVHDTSEEIIVASAKDLRIKGKNVGGDRNQNNLIIAEDAEDEEKK